MRLALAILIYFVVGFFIYRAWWSARAGTRADLPLDPATIEARIRYDHYTWLGLRYYARRDFGNAEVAFRKSTQYGSHRPLAYNNLGSALNARGEWDEAITALEHALALDSSLTIARKNLAWARAQRARRGR